MSKSSAFRQNIIKEDIFVENQNKQYMSTISAAECIAYSNADVHYFQVHCDSAFQAKPRMIVGGEWNVIRHPRFKTSDVMDWGGSKFT